MQKISPPPGFDPRTIQPVASRYTDWAIPTHDRYGSCSIVPGNEMNPKEKFSKNINWAEYSGDCWRVCGDGPVFSARMNAFWLTKDLCTRRFVRQRHLCNGGIFVSGHMGIPIFCYSLFAGTFSWKKLYGECSIWKHLKDKCVIFLSLLPSSLVVWFSALCSRCTQRLPVQPPIHLDYDLLEYDAVQVHRYKRFGRAWYFYLLLRNRCSNFLWRLWLVHWATLCQAKRYSLRNSHPPPETSNLTNHQYIHSSNQSVGRPFIHQSVHQFID
jgi:hypothetical protein